MSEPGPVASTIDVNEIRSRLLRLYSAIVGLSLAAIAVLLVYLVTLGTIIGPGVEQSFGFGVALLFLLGALLVHVVDRTYREWPLGRRIHPTSPGWVTDATIAGALRIAVVAGAGLVIAYLLAVLLS